MRRILILVSLLAVGSCDGPTEPGPGEEPGDDGSTVGGTIQNNVQVAIPADARIVVGWAVSSGSPDYTYVFGDGTIDRSNGTFEVTFEGPPPVAALNAGVLGVGIIVATTDQEVGTGDDLADVLESEIVGAAGAYGVIYVADTDGAAASRSWAEEFGAGYGVGMGQEVPGSFDAFIPVGASGAVLVIDDLENIDFVNWT